MTADVTNTIFWNGISHNKHLILLEDYTGSDHDILFTVNHSLIPDGKDGIYVLNNFPINWAEGNLINDPRYADPSGHDFSLDWQSPCIEAGTGDISSLDLLPYDLAGEPRVVNDRIDMGAYEYQFPVYIPSEPSENNEYSIFPVPAESSISVSWQDESDKPVMICLYDLHLRQLGRFSVNGQGKMTELDIGGLSPGVYSLVLITGEKVSTVKIVKI